MRSVPYLRLVSPTPAREGPAPCSLYCDPGGGLVNLATNDACAYCGVARAEHSTRARLVDDALRAMRKEPNP